MMFHVIVGLGEVGTALEELYHEAENQVVGWDLKRLTHGSSTSFVVPGFNQLVTKAQERGETIVLHICFPYTENFIPQVKYYLGKFDPHYCVIHSTVKPGTTALLKSSACQTIYSPVRGQHDKLAEDLQGYPKIWTVAQFETLTRDNLNEIKQIFGEARMISLPALELTATQLEIIKVLDTTQYASLIAYAHIAEAICTYYELPHEYVQEFGLEVHRQTGMRPPIYPGGLGGHCLRPNLELLLKTLPKWRKEFPLDSWGLLIDDFLTTIQTIDNQWKAKNGKKNGQDE